MMAFVTAASLWLTVWVQGAAASTITETVSFVAKNFTSGLGHASAPTDPVTGSFTFTLDPTQTYTNETSGLVLNHVDVPVDSTLGFNGNPAFRTVQIGGVYADVNGIVTGMSNDFIFDFSLDPADQFGFFMYTELGVNDYFKTEDVTVSFSPQLASTPLPGSVIMLLTALGALGGCGVLRAAKAKQPVLAA
jgi:hypothetical protein